MKLSQLPFNEIYIGQKVQSDTTKRFGFVMLKLPREEDYRKEDNLISIWWENDSMSLDGWHFQLDKVTALEFINE